MSVSTPYWNPLLETMPREKLRELQLSKLKRVVRWGYERSKLYRRLYEQAGFHPDDLRTWDDVSKVPMISKEDYRQAQAKEPWPYGDSLCVPLEQVTEYHQTSGTTGQPVYQPDTWQDWEWWSECWSYILWSMGFRPTDRVFLPFGYNVFVAFWAGHYAAEKIGCEVIAGGILNTEERLLKIKELRATALMGTPTYMLNMAETCERKLGFPARELGIKKIVCAGEPGASVEGTKKRISEAWGAEVFDHVGATEVGAWSFECTHHPGGIHVNEAMFLLELIDMETNAPIEEPGKMGKIVLTSLDRQAQPCIRFDTKDLGMWSDSLCTCGRTFRVLKGGVLGRADHLTKVKGVLFSPLAAEEVVRAMPELGDEYELIVTKKGEVDELILKVELLPAYEGEKERVKQELARQLRLKTNLAYVIEFHPLGSLPRYEQKAKRFKDLRSHS